MKTTVTAIVLLAGAALLWADDQTTNVQQALKEQGFYYGEITGEKNAETAAAIRRFQIRNGLQVTGELNDETLRTLGVGNAPQLVAKETPAASPDNSDLRSEPHEKEPPANSARDATQEQQVYPTRSVTAVPENGALFSGTPYENASPEIQHNVIASAQSALARRGLYRGELDGIYGPNMEFSLRAYQSRVGLRATGRLDLETLAALELLAGARTPIYSPRRRVLREEPVRGQWIPGN